MPNPDGTIDRNLNIAQFIYISGGDGGDCMFIGVILLLAVCAYIIVVGIITGLKKDSQTRTHGKNVKKSIDKIFIARAIGVVFLIIAYMLIIPVPKPGRDRWFNSVLFLRLFWKMLGSLFAASGSFIITMLIGTGIGTLFNKQEKANRKKRSLGWKSLEKDEALSAFNELYNFEKGKVESTISAQNITYAHEGYYGRFNKKIEQVAKMAPLAEVRIAAIRKMRSKSQLESCLSIEKDESVRKAIEMEIAIRGALRY